MRIKIIAMGKLSAGPEKQLIDDYLRRLPWQAEVVELDIKKPAREAAKRKKEEAEKLLAAVPHGSMIVVLDERGKNMASRAFASKISKAMDEGVNSIAFIIGGADGLDETVRQKASLTLSFGSLTWPHMLVRTMLAEQIYRAWSIITGHPYHRD